MKFLGLNDFQFKDQRVLLRLDLNAPIEAGEVSNDERLIRSLPTIKHILNILQGFWRPSKYLIL